MFNYNIIIEEFFARYLKLKIKVFSSVKLNKLNKSNNKKDEKRKISKSKKKFDTNISLRIKNTNIKS